MDGSFETKLSNWFADQFVGRNGFIHLRYGMLKLLGQKKIDDIYLCKNQLIEDAKLPNQKQMARNLSAINKFAKSHSDINTTFSQSYSFPFKKPFAKTVLVEFAK